MDRVALTGSVNAVASFQGQTALCVLLSGMVVGVKCTVMRARRVGAGVSATITVLVSVMVSLQVGTVTVVRMVGIVQLVTCGARAT